MTESPKTGKGGLGPNIWWRWYHFYFVLAFFNLLVIGASLMLYHQTLESFQLALRKLTVNHNRLRWVTSLRLAVLDLNAPGNDVFATRKVAEEQARFDQMHAKLQTLLTREREFDEDIMEFRGHIERMIAEERTIFARFTSAQDFAMPAEDSQRLIQEASVVMANMDRHQASALNALAELEQTFLARESSLLKEHEARLRFNASFEKYFLGTVVLILIGMSWYGRQLQSMHERMARDEQLATAARHERLAAVGEVCSAVAHGIRNPLAAISTSAQLALRYGSLDGVTERRVQDIEHECRRLDRRIERLLNFASVPVQATEHFDLAAVVKGAISELQPHLDQQKVRIIHEESGGPFPVQGDREWMTQSVIELISNAVDHVTDAGTIRVRCSTCRDPLPLGVVDVIDDGPGVPESIRGQVFDMFFSTKKQGTGLGLASVKRAAEFHGGDAAIIESDGKGAHFRLRVPLATG